jgi:hypothetical protein
MVKYRIVPEKCVFCNRTVKETRVNAKFQGNVIWVICDECKKMIEQEARENGS